MLRSLVGSEMCIRDSYYTGPHPEHQQAEMINSGNPEYIELWNLVFIQFDRDKSGAVSYTHLTLPTIYSV